ncbi:hypothetical protein [Bacillus cereus]|nr:hypothetical protein [Bacillus cereus]
MLLMSIAIPSERQDRCPNAGIIRLSKPQYWYLTECECWRL